MTLFWPELPTESAQRNLRNALHHLRRVIPTVNGEGEKDDVPFVLADRWTIQINPDGRFQLDVTLFEKLTISPKVADWEKAITLYHDSFLSDFYLPNSPDFEDWAQVRRADLRRRFLNTLVKLASHALDKADFAQAEHYARQQLAIDNLREEAHRQLMLVLVQNGRRTDALTHYQTLYQLLQDELGISPSLEIEALVDTIYSDNWKKEAEVKSQKPIPHNLPPQLTPFVGREAELMQLQKLLAQPDVHLITILGPGGIGKTRLALALAEQILSKQDGDKAHPYQHGVCFASLAQLGTADSLLAALAEAVRFSFRDSQDQKEQLLRYLSNRSMLLLLDNFEHLLAGTGLVAEILQHAPQIKIVITSRVRVNRRSEQLFPIEGMAYPSGHESRGRNEPLAIAQYSAVRLFVQCARRVQPNFALTADNQDDVLHICQLLQGMPLGLVLAASWLSTLSPRAISHHMQEDLDFLATEMADVPSRQRSLRTAFNHSWRLLSQREQAIFCQMSIFRGGFSRAAAQTVTEATLRDLRALVNKSLLTLSPDRRYNVHELIRQFAAEQLSEREALETAVRERHSHYYCALLKQQTPNWHNAHQLDTVAQVSREANNIQVAWEWARQQEAWPRLHEAIDSWGSYHQWCGLRENGERFCEAICTHLEKWATTKPVDAVAGYLLWARAMIWYGQFAMAVRIAVQRIQQSLTLLAHPDLAGADTHRIEAFALLSLGLWLQDYNRPEARSYLEKSLLLQEALKISWAQSVSLSALGYLDWTNGDYASALQRIEMSLAICQNVGDQWQEVDVIFVLGWLYLHLGRLEESEQLRHRALDLCQQLNNQASFVAQLVTIPYPLGWQGRFAEGQQWAKKGIAASQEAGNLGSKGFAQLALGWLLMHDGQYTSAHQLLTRSLILKRAENNRGVQATVHYGLGCVTLVQGDHDQAYTAFEESLRLYQMVQGDAYTFFALSGLGLITCYRGELDRSRHYFAELLTDGLKRQDFLWILTALPGMSLYWLKWGDREQALKIWTQALCYPHIANSQFYEDIVGRVVREGTADLPPPIIEAAEANGRSQDIWCLAESFLADIKSEP